MELKTLKDFPKEVIGMEDYRLISSNKLKQEAIKWIKELNNNPKKYQERFTNYDGYGIDAYEVINWIKYFFNITEDDLKSEK